MDVDETINITIQRNIIRTDQNMKITSTSYDTEAKYVTGKRPSSMDITTTSTKKKS